MSNFEMSDAPNERFEPMSPQEGGIDFDDAPANAVTCDSDEGELDIEDGLPAEACDSTDRPVAQTEVREREPDRPLEAPRQGQHSYQLDGVDTHGLTAEQIDQQYREGAEARRASLSFEGERSLTPQEEDALGAYNEKLIAIGKDLGVDLRDRVTKPEHVHLFPRPDDYRAAAAATVPGTENARGFTSPTVGVLAVARVDPLDNIYGVQHEGTHDASHRWVTPHVSVGPDGAPRVDVAQSRVRVGYMDQGARGVHGMNESTTDMVTHRGMVDSGQGRIHPGYGVGSLLLSGVIMDTAAKLTRPGDPVTPQMVENEITKGMLSPDRVGLQMVQNALGVPAVNMLLDTGGYMQTTPTAMLAGDMGSPTAAANLWGREAGVRIPFFPWR